MNAFPTCLSDEEGASGVAYGITAGLITVLMMSTVALVGGDFGPLFVDLAGTFSDIADGIRARAR